MKKLLFILFVLFSIQANCQLLTATRAKHLKECTVRITIPGTSSVGTGFIIDQAGTVITCFHVIAPAFRYNPTNKNFDIGDIEIELHNGKKIHYGIPSTISMGIDTMTVYDISALVPKTPIGSPTPFLKIGNFSSVMDGDEVVTCGYPFGMTHPFISRGMVGSKIIDTVLQSHLNGLITKIPRNEALIDITMNKGNSGGPIYKIGDSEGQDEVIGIADFIVTPIGKDIVDLSESLKATNKSGGYVEIGGINPNKALDMVVTTLTNSSDGVSGCVSIEYLQALVVIAKKGVH